MTFKEWFQSGPWSGDIAKASNAGDLVLLLETCWRAAQSVERERCATSAENYAAGAGVVNDAEGFPFCRCRGCEGEGAGYEIAELIRAVPAGAT